MELVARLAVFAFVVASMSSVGLSLSFGEIHEPFKSPRLVLRALTANFIAVPLLAYLITKAIPVNPSLMIALMLLGTASGAPMLPKLVEFAKGNLALAVGLMGLLMATTVVYVPLVLPMLLPGVHAQAWSIAKPLLGVTLPPLLVGLAVRAYRKEIASRLARHLRVASNITLLVVISAAITVNYSNVIQMSSLEAIAAGATLFLGSFGIGFALGGGNAETRLVLGLGAIVRNVSVSFLIAVENFRESNVVNYVAILGLVAVLIQLPVARLLGKRVPRQTV